MNCPRCGTPMSGGLCPSCGFPENRKRPVTYKRIFFKNPYLTVGHSRQEKQ